VLGLGVAETEQELHDLRLMLAARRNFASEGHELVDLPRFDGSIHIVLDTCVRSEDIGAPARTAGSNADVN